MVDTIIHFDLHYFFWNHSLYNDSLKVCNNDWFIIHILCRTLSTVQGIFNIHDY